MKIQLNKSEQAFYMKLINNTMSKFNLTAIEASDKIKETITSPSIHNRLDAVVKLLK